MNIRDILRDKLPSRPGIVTGDRRSRSLNEIAVRVVYFKGEAIPLLNLIGEGKYAEIYKTSMKINGIETNIAVKAMKNTTTSWRHIRDLNGEINVLLALPKSPWIIQCYGIATVVDGPSFTIEDPINLGGFLLEYCPYGDLNKVLKENTFEINQPLLEKWIGQAIRAVHFLHNQEIPIVHRDIKSLNFLVSKDRSLKLSDFALSRKFIASDKSASLEKFRTTPIWAPPELLNLGIYSLESDIYSLGLVIWEMMYYWTHNKIYHIPYNVSNIYYLIIQLTDTPDERPPLDNIPEDWANLITSCWKTQISERISAGEALQMYENIIR